MYIRSKSDQFCRIRYKHSMIMELHYIAPTKQIAAKFPPPENPQNRAGENSPNISDVALSPFGKEFALKLTMNKFNLIALN